MVERSKLFPLGCKLRNYLTRKRTIVSGESSDRAQRCADRMCLPSLGQSLSLQSAVSRALCWHSLGLGRTHGLSVIIQFAITAAHLSSVPGWEDVCRIECKSQIYNLINRFQVLVNRLSSISIDNGPVSESIVCPSDDECGPARSLPLAGVYSRPEITWITLHFAGRVTFERVANRSHSKCKCGTVQLANANYLSNLDCHFLCLH